MASSKDKLLNVLASVFAIFAFIAFVAFYEIQLRIADAEYRKDLLVGDVTTEQSAHLASEKTKLLDAYEKALKQYSTAQNNANKKDGFKQKYANAYGKINGFFPNYPEYMDGDVPRPFTFQDEMGNVIEDSGLLQNIERTRSSRRDERDKADNFNRVSREEIKNHPQIIKEQNQNIQHKIDDIKSLEWHLVNIKLEADKEIKSMREDYNRMNNDLNTKVDSHLKQMDKKSTVLTEMKTRLDILKRREFELQGYDELKKLSRKDLEREAEKEKMKDFKHLDNDQLTEAVFRTRNIDGKVMSVSTDGKVVMIEVGSYQGVKPGQVFNVFELRNGVNKIDHGKIVVKEVKRYVSLCSPIASDNGELPLLVKDYYVGDFDFQPFQKFEYIFVGEFKARYTQEELEFMVRKSGGSIKEVIGYTSNFLVLGEKPVGTMPNEEITNEMKDEFLYNKKTIPEIIKKFGFNKEITQYVVLFESSKEMGVRILDETKLLKHLSNE